MCHDRQTRLPHHHKHHFELDLPFVNLFVSTRKLVAATNKLIFGLTRVVYWLCVTLLWYVILACQVVDPYRLIKSNKFIFEILQVKGRAFPIDGQLLYP